MELCGNICSQFVTHTTKSTQNLWNQNDITTHTNAVLPTKLFVMQQLLFNMFQQMGPRRNRYIPPCLRSDESGWSQALLLLTFFIVQIMTLKMWAETLQLQDGSSACLAERAPWWNSQDLRRQVWWHEGPGSQLFLDQPRGGSGAATCAGEGAWLRELQGLAHGRGIVLILCHYQGGPAGPARGGGEQGGGGDVDWVQGGEGEG